MAKQGVKELEMSLAKHNDFEAYYKKHKQMAHVVEVVQVSEIDQEPLAA